jgi:hypothetical protein
MAYRGSIQPSAFARHTLYQANTMPLNGGFSLQIAISDSGMA